jgi:DNA-binding NtrC family response regulator
MTRTNAMRTLIVEDEWVIATLIEQTLTEAGIEVLGKPGSVGKALRWIEEMSCDAAVLDADLGGASAEPVAAALPGAPQACQHSPQVRTSDEVGPTRSDRSASKSANV